MSLSFEGVRVQIPFADGIGFNFVDGNLVLTFSAFTGSVTLQKKLETEQPAKPASSDLELKESAFRTPKNSKSTAAAESEEDICASAQSSEPPSQWYQEDAFTMLSQDQSEITKQSSVAAQKLKRQRVSREKKSAVAEIRDAAAKTSDPSWCSISPMAKEFATELASDGLAKKGKEGNGVVPEARWGHTATMISSTQMVAYGGVANEENQNLGDVHIYDLKERRWSRPVNCESLPRAWHSATFLEEKNILLVFGGERNITDTPEVLDDIMVLDTEIFLWYPPAVSGKAPSPRAGHSASLVRQEGNAMVVVFGGVRGRKWQNSLHVLDTERWHWSQPRISGGKPPKARCYHTATVANEGTSIVFFGGNDANDCFDTVEVLQLTNDGEEGGGGGRGRGSDKGLAPAPSCHSWSWFRPCIVGEGPCARTGHTAVLVAPHTILFYGGWDPQSDDADIRVEAGDQPEVFEDAYLLDTLAWEWTPAPSPMAATSMNATDDAVADAVADAEIEAEAEVGAEVGKSGVASEKGRGRGRGRSRGKEVSGKRTRQGAVKQKEKKAEGAGKRTGHSAVALMAIESGSSTRHRSTMLYFGGQDQEGERKNDLRRQVISI